MVQIAVAIAIPYRTYQDYEAGNRTISLENAMNLAKFYKISVEELCTYGE